MKWADIKPRMFVEMEVLDHTETGDDGHVNGSGEWDRDDAGVQPFRVWGQVLRVTHRELVIEGAWQWIGDEDLPIEYNVFTVVRGAVVGRVRLLQRDFMGRKRGVGGPGGPPLA